MTVPQFIEIYPHLKLQWQRYSLLKTLSAVKIVLICWGQESLMVD